MSFIGKNIRKIRSVKGFSQSKLAEILGLKRANIGAYEEGRAEPKLDTITKIANHFGISMEDLLNKELTVNELYRFDIFQPDLKSGAPTEATGDSLKHIPVVTIKYHHAYVTHWQDETFINSLPAIQVPDYLLKGNMAFQIRSDTSLRQITGLHNKDILLCDPVAKKDWPGIQGGKLFMVVFKKELALRRIYRNGDSFRMEPSHKEAVAYEDVLALWEVQAVISKQVSTVTPLEQRVSELEDQLAKVLKKLK